MKRLIWLLALVGVVYTVNEVRTHGLEGAFGGVLAGKLEPLESEDETELPLQVE
ncbi:MAG TPA: hypothetical protein VII78_10915 [Myxococcota bacterium]|jgi:hypothetical protein